MRSAARLLQVATAVALTCAATCALAGERKRVLNCPITASSFSDCDPLSYVIKIGAAVGPGVIISILMVLALPWFVVLRFSCNTCGARNPRPNLCCAPSADKQMSARYSVNDIRRAKLFMLLCSGVAIGALIWGNAVSSVVVTGLNDFGGAVQGTPARIFSRVQEMERSLTLPLYNGTSDTTTTVNFFGDQEVMRQATNLTSSLDAMIRDSVGVYRARINDFSFVLFIIFSVPSGVVIAGGPIALLSIRKYLPMLLVLLTFVLGVGVWIVHGVFAGTSLLMDDVCTEISGVANQRRNIIAPLIGCSSAMFQNYMTSFRELRDARARDVCDQIVPMCYDSGNSAAQNVQEGKVYECPAGGLMCPNQTLQSLIPVIKRLRLASTVQGSAPAVAVGASCASPQYASDCQLVICADDCVFPNGTRSELGRLSKGVVSLLDVASAVSSVIDTLGNQFGNCDAILSFLLQSFDSPCRTMVKGMAQARDAAGMQGIACVSGIFALVFGSKRFISGDMANKPLNEDGEVVEG